MIHIRPFALERDARTLVADLQAAGYELQFEDGRLRPQHYRVQPDQGGVSVVWNDHGMQAIEFRDLWLLPPRGQGRWKPVIERALAAPPGVGYRAQLDETIEAHRLQVALKKHPSLVGMRRKSVVYIVREGAA